MFVSKHSNGYYYLYYFDSKGKRQKKSTKSKFKAEALKFLHSFDVNSAAKKQSGMSLKKFSWEFLKYSESQNTWKTTLTYRTTFNSLQKFLGQVIIREISTFDVDKFIRNRIKNVSLHAGRKDLINVKAAFNWAVRMNMLTRNPAESIKRIKLPEKQPRFFTKGDFEKLIEIIDNPQIRDITEIAVNTGMRQMEILSLRWSQINLDEGYVTLNNQNHITKGKKIRTIPLNKNSVRIFKSLKRNTCNELIFHLNEKPINQDYLVKNFKKYVIKANINPQLNFHSLRHTFASWLVQRGVSIYQVSKLLGHADIKTTEIYAHVRAEDLRKSINMLNI